MEKQDNFQIKVKLALLRRGMSVKELAEKLDRPRSSVSQAINQERFFLLKKLITQELSLYLK